MNSPKISIVIPVYNNERFLGNAVNSVIRQEFYNIEVIIVDDGSTDRTPYIADEIALRDNRIKVIHQENRWIYGSMNRGIIEASGEYIYILNSDDILYSDSLSKMAAVLDKKQVDVIWTRIDEYDYYDNYVQYVRSDKEYNKDIILNNKEEIQQIWPQLYFDHIAVNQANLYKRELMLRHPFREDVYGADVLFNIDIADEVNTAYILKDAVYRFYDYHSDKNNASIGKYYPYEHEMFNEFYTGYLNLFGEWGISSKLYKEKLADIRIRQVTREVRSYGFNNCMLSNIEKIKHILSDIADEIVMKCAREFEREWEVESRILSGINDVFYNKEINDVNLKELIDGLICLRFSENKALYNNWDKVINHELNKCKVGKIYLEHFN